MLRIGLVAAVTLSAMVRVSDTPNLLLKSGTQPDPFPPRS
jgi:hypothetical protein